jgi:hypothetical protein
LTVFYADASALTKRYLEEVGTGWIRGITDLAGVGFFAGALTPNPSP